MMITTLLFLVTSIITYIVWHFNRPGGPKPAKAPHSPAYTHNLKALQTYAFEDLQVIAYSAFSDYQVYDATGSELVYIPIGTIHNLAADYPLPVVIGDNFKLYYPDQGGKFEDSRFDVVDYSDFCHTLFTSEDNLVNYCSADILPENKFTILSSLIATQTRKLQNFETNHFDPTTSHIYRMRIQRYQELLASTVGKTHPELLL